jgi:endonuclease/exonuclease/phosphatase family metal-dependent hydrolase
MTTIVAVSRAKALRAGLAAILTFTAGSVLAQEPQAKDRPLRVMTYNIKHGQTNATCVQPPGVPGQPPFPDCNLDLSASIEVMRAHAPDIVGVQEVDRFWARSGGVDEPADMADALGMEHYCYAANLDHPRDTHANVPHQYGTVILSRFPILECENTLLRRTGSNEQRGLTRALINVRGVPLDFYNTHLHTTAADRLMQTADIAAVIDAAPSRPRVLMGDFNARPTTTEMQPVYARFADAWLAAAEATPENPNGFTSPARLASHSSPNPSSRIDYVFVSSDVQVSNTYVPIDASTRLAADHYPVVSDIALPGFAVGVRRTEATVPDLAEGEETEHVAPEDDAGAPPPN